MKILKKFVPLFCVFILLSSCVLMTSCKKADTRFVESDTVYNIVLKESSVQDLPLNMILDESSKITLRSDGTATIFLKSVRIDRILEFAFDNFDIGSLNLTEFVQMATQYFPGFSVGDMEKSLGMLKANMGLELKGFDFTDPETDALFAEIDQTMTLPRDAKYPENLILEYNPNYYIQEVYSETKGSYMGVFMGNHEKNGEPYLIMTKTTDKDSGKSVLKYYNVMLNAYLIAIEA